MASELLKIKMEARQLDALRLSDLHDDDIELSLVESILDQPLACIYEGEEELFLSDFSTQDSFSDNDSITDGSFASISSLESALETMMFFSDSDDTDDDCDRSLQQLEIDIMIHAKAGKLESVLLMLERSSYGRHLVDICDKHGNTLLHFAASCTEESPSLVRLLLQLGANVNRVNNKGLTPLALNVIKRNRDATNTIPSILMFFGANPDYKMNNGSTPLHLAMDLRHWELAKMLVKRGASINVSDSNGNMVWEKYPQMKYTLLSSIRLEPKRISMPTRKDCMACKDLYTRVAFEGTCGHCARSCCENCLSNKISSNLFPEGFHSSKTAEAKKRKIQVCTTCKDILVERNQKTKGKANILSKLPFF